MNAVMIVLTILVILIAVALMFAFVRRINNGQLIGLRPLPVYAGLHKQAGRAVESGSQVHVTLGRGGLHEAGGPTSLAALTILDTLAQEGCASNAPPIVTVGEGTLFPAGQDSLRAPYERSGRVATYPRETVQFVADQTAPMAYAAGTADVIKHQNITSTIALGHFGSELALIAEASGRANVQQIIATTDPIAISLATAITAETLPAEDLLAAGAYLQGTPIHLASLKAQDILRSLAILVILLVALLHLFGLL